MKLDIWNDVAEITTGNQRTFEGYFYACFQSNGIYNTYTCQHVKSSVKFECLVLSNLNEHLQNSAILVEYKQGVWLKQLTRSSRQIYHWELFFRQFAPSNLKQFILFQQHRFHSSLNKPNCHFLFNFLIWHQLL